MTLVPNIPPHIPCRDKMKGSSRSIAENNADEIGGGVGLALLAEAMSDSGSDPEDEAHGSIGIDNDRSGSPRKTVEACPASSGSKPQAILAIGRSPCGFGFGSIS